MQGLFKFTQPAFDTLEVRPAQLADRAAVNAFTENTYRVHFNLDWWTFDQWLYPDRPSDAIWLAFFQQELVGLLLLPFDGGPTAWVRALAIANGAAAEPIANALFNTARSALRAYEVEQVAVLAHPTWVGDLTHRLNFTVNTEIVTLRKTDRDLPVDYSSAVPLRAATALDVTRMAAIDRAAFDPTWWYSAQTLTHILKAVPHFIVADMEEAIAGYAFSDVYGGQGHLIRLVVHPDYQRRGIGERLLVESLRYQIELGAHPLTLNTQSANTVSQELYRRYGFQPIGHPILVMRCGLE